MQKNYCSRNWAASKFGYFFILLFLCGCAVENERLASYPLFSRRSDKIPGLVTPSQRRDAIRQKGDKGRNAPVTEQELLLGQLAEEYKTNPDQNLRRDAIEAISKIPHSSNQLYLVEALNDASPFVRISACRSITDKKVLCDIVRDDKDKDVRLEAIKAVTRGKSAAANREVLTMLAATLQDKTPAIRYAAMDSLGTITRLDYGHDINAWLAWADYEIDGKGTLPPQRTAMDKLPKLHLPMLK